MLIPDSHIAIDDADKGHAPSDIRPGGTGLILPLPHHATVPVSPPTYANTQYLIMVSVSQDVVRALRTLSNFGLY